MKKLSLIVLFILSLLNLPSQNCPTSISLESSPMEGMTGQSLSFRVYVNGVKPELNISYNWSISMGTITSGQGTSSITVDPGTEAGTSTATVELGGLPRECSSVKSLTVDIRQAPEKIIATNTVTTTGINDAVKKFIGKTDFKNINIIQTALVNVYPGAPPSQFAKIKSMIEKAFETNGVFSYQYKIADGGVKKVAAVEIFLVQGF